MRELAYAVALVAGAYQLIALIASVRFRTRRRSWTPAEKPVSVLKPAHSADAGFVEAVESHLAQRYPDFELLIGTANPELVLAEGCRAQIIRTSTKTANGKVGTLIDLVRAARHEILVVNDADIRVPPNYLAQVTAPLADPGVGLVTCLYRAHGSSFAARFEALGIATDFGPSALVAPLVGVDEFAFGSTLAFRKRDLARIGGFEAIGDYLADDYQLGKRLHALGLRCVLSDVVVDTGVGGKARGAKAWSEVWRHQVRWARTIRVSRFGGYAGLPVTFATVWAGLLAVAGFPVLAIALLVIRMLTAAAGVIALRDAEAASMLILVPLRDLFGAAVWLAGLFGSHVEWRGRRLRLDGEGRIQPGADHRV